ncbi:MAG: MFS transporter [Chlamydiae bacterium]|nr:MFS transporter [Chlamydiota bacterium]
MLFKSIQKGEKPSSFLRIFLIILLAIFVDQSIEDVLLESIVSIDPTGWISNIYLLAAIPFALFLASLSDFHCRRRILIFALTSLVVSGIFILFFLKYDNNWIAYIALMFKATGGNVTPVALASVATIAPLKKFTTSLAVAICAYALGSWVPIYLRSFTHIPLILIVFSLVVISVVCYIIAIKWFKEASFDGFKFENNSLNLKCFFSFARKDLKEIAHFCLLTPVILVFSGYIFSEISFYQILLRGELLAENDFYSSLSLKLGLGYYAGTGILWFLQRRGGTDGQCLKLGTVIAFLSLVSAVIFSYVESSPLYKYFIPSLSLGFALFIPSLFSILSKIKNLDDQGKIYGLLDSTDTISVLIAAKYIKSSKLASYNNVFWISSTILLIGSIIMWSFIHYAKNMRRNNGNPYK